MVLAYHYTYVGYVHGGIGALSFPEIGHLTETVWAGVSLFFMISGFVIAFSAERATAYDFMVSRIARLDPAFLFCMTMTAIVLLFAGSHKFVEMQMSLSRWLANLTMVPLLFKQTFVDGTYSSIVTEITFYFWVVVLMACGVFQKHIIRILALWLLFSAANEFWLTSAVFNKLFAPQYACHFALGILSYRAFARHRLLNWSETLVGVLAVIMAFKSDHSVQQWMIANDSFASEWSWIGSLLKTVFFLAVLNVFVRIPAVLHSNRCYVLGGLTYPLYLLHSNIGFTLYHYLDAAPFGFNRWISLTLVTAGMVVLACGVFRIIEPAGRRLVFIFFNSLKPIFARFVPQLVR